jgi:alkylation response protein AidB-like acyl-CoA dehydrogenase
MDLRESGDDQRFRREVRDFLEDSLSGEFSAIRGRGGPGDEHEAIHERISWERYLGAHGWTCVAWPVEHGGRGLSLHQQVIYFEEYARARGPGRVGHIGETLIGPTIIAFGTQEQQERFLPPIVRGEELWCQGYSEPDAGSDLANLATRAVLDGDEWVIDGQKVWTSNAQWSDWCFVLARTDPAAPRHKGIGYLLVPMAQEGIDIRPIVQLTGTSEFNEVFFDGARTAASNVVGAANEGWKVAMGTLAFERGASTLGQVLQFQNEYDEIVEHAVKVGRSGDPRLRQRLVDVWARLLLMRLNALRVMASGPEQVGPSMITKLFWATLHRDMGELAMDVLGIEGQVVPGGGTPDDLTRLQRLFLFSRADTIYAGTNEIQRNIIGERALGLPR